MCQNLSMSLADDQSVTADRIASELADCRQRGLERLDRRSHNQEPLVIPQLERLAARHSIANGNAATGRIAQIKQLLRACLAAYARDGDATAAELLADLLFGDADNVILRSAGELLDRAQLKFGEKSRERFLERRRLAFQEFAAFLIRFCASIKAAEAPAARPPTGPVVAAAERAVAAGRPRSAATPLADSAAGGAPASEQDRIAAALETASQITICGVAPRSLVRAMQVVAERASTDGRPVPWREITYVTPTSTLILATLGNARLGPAMQKWQSALKELRDCVQQVQAFGTQAGGPGQVRLTFLGVMELYLDVVVLIRDENADRQQLWTSLGPSLTRDEPFYVSFEAGTEEFAQLKAMTDQLLATGVPAISRELEVRPDGLELIRRLPPAAPPRGLAVRSLEPLGSADPLVPLPSCLPVAITIIRSAEAGRPVMLLKQRSRFASWDDFGKLSLLSSGVHEEDLAAALGVPVFHDREAAAALDAMWKAYGKADRLPIPLAAFRRAAQREIFASCGLDIAAERYVHRGCRLLERDGRGRYLFFCTFELVLFRHRHEDELQLAREWDPVRLVPVYEDVLYSPDGKLRLNRFLTHSQEWLQAEILSKPITLAGKAAPGRPGDARSVSGGSFPPR
jgi:hypothetical protein